MWWLSCYLRVRHAKTCFRGVKLTSRKVSTGVPQGSKLSLFSFYIVDMPRPTELVKLVCYADDLPVWATGVKIPDLEDSINSYLDEITAATLFSPDPHQATSENTHWGLTATAGPILGVYLDTSLSFNKHSGYVAERVSSKNNIPKALTGTSWAETKMLNVREHSELLSAQFFG